MAATAPRSFRRAAAKKEARPVVAFTLDWVDDEDEENVLRSDTFHATMPTDERLFLIAAAMGQDDEGVASEAAAIMDLLRDSLPPAEYRVLRSRLADPADSVDMEVMSEVLEWLMEKWSDFPTQPSSESSKSPTTSGQKSTGRVRGPGSTRSTSPSPAS